MKKVLITLDDSWDDELILETFNPNNYPGIIDFEIVKHCGKCGESNNLESLQLKDFGENTIDLKSIRLPDDMADELIKTHEELHRENHLEEGEKVE